MATKVNTKFVIVLSASLVITAGVVAGLAWMVLSKSGEDFVRQGDRLVQEGDPREAARMYARAVSRDRTNTAWIEKWRDALLASTPETDAEYQRDYSTHYVSMILSQLAALRQTDPQAQHDLLSEHYRRLRMSNPEGRTWGEFVDMTDQALLYLDASDPDTRRLRRYRGLALLHQSRTLTLSQDQERRLEEDLRVAIEADPQDMESRLGLVDWAAGRASREFTAGRREESARLWNNADEQCVRLIEEHPGDPRPMLRRLEMHLVRVQQTAIDAAERRRAASTIEPMAREVIDAALSFDPMLIDLRFLERFGRVISQIAPADAAEHMLRLTTRIAEARPDDSSVLLLQAVAMAQSGRSAEAIDAFERVGNMPDKPVSFEGMMLRRHRVEAMRRRAEQALAMWERAQPAERSRSLERARTYRDDLAERVGEDDLSLLRVDALLAYAEGRFREAVRLFSDLNSATGGSDVEILFFLANSLEREGSLGAALQQYERIVSLNPANVMARMSAANLEMSRRDFNSAQRWLRDALNADPDNQQVRERLAAVDALLADDVESVSQDPVIAALQTSRRLRTGDTIDLAGAARVIDDALQRAPDDVRLVLERVAIDAQGGRRDAAIVRVNEALARTPDDDALRNAKMRLEIEDPVELQLAMIDASGLSPIDKLIRRAVVFATAGREDAAAGALREAAALEPDNPGVIEMRFARALDTRDFSTAREMASKAAARNLDQLGGLLYQGRLELAEERYESAVATFDRAVQQLEYNPIAWRLLAEAQMSVGRVNAALDSYRRAFEIRPDDPQILRPYLAALASVGREAEGLELTRRAVNLNQADLAILEAWLRLEERHGDSDEALLVRERRFSADPANTENNIALVRLLLSKRDWPGAKRVLDAMPTEGSAGMLTAVLEARWHALQGDLDAGRRRIDRQIATLDGEEAGRGYLALVDFLIENGRDQEARIALEEARRLQSSEFMEADRRMGDLYFGRNEFEEAIEAYTRVIDAGADTDNIVAKRTAEALLRLERWDDVERKVRGIEQRSARDLQTVLLLAEASRGKGDMRAARRFADEAVALAPTDPMSFVRRAQFNIDDETQFGAVMQDLEQALRLRPSLVQARQLRAEVYRRQGRSSDAIAELRASVEQLPGDDALRMLLVRELMNANRMEDARVAAANAAAARAESEPMWHRQAGDVFVATGDPRGAVTHYRRMYDRDPSTESLVLLVTAMLDATPTQATQARQALDAHRFGDEPFEQLVMHALRARQRAAAGEQEPSQRAMREAWAIARETPQGTRYWFEQAVRVFGTNPMEIIAFIETMERREALNATARVQVARMLASDRERWSESLQLMSGLERQTDDAQTVLDMFRLRGQIYYFQNRYQDAADAYRAGLQISPDDAELNNNLAYTMATNLDDAAGALPYAQRAAQRDPQNPNILDTLGWIYHQVGDRQRADTTLTRALSLARTPAQQIAANVHLAHVRMESGDRTSAREHYRAARRIAENQPQLAEPYTALLDSLRTGLNATE
ncbi:MAG: tetratricopeptide repeat protein [Phycisphaerales bacterium]|nr:MAG: tetratricopeptide repeat protein [Phycisphaerales bacterium]